MDVSHCARPSALVQPRVPRHGTIPYSPPWHASMRSFELQVAAPSSSALHGSPDLSPLKSQLVPCSVVAQPCTPLHGVSMKCKAWHASSRLLSIQRASPLSHELPTPG